MTFGTMKTRIADEMARADLTTQIGYAILSAIKHYQRERFFFNEQTWTFSTVQGQEYYTSSDLAALPNILELDSVKISINGQTYTLRERDFAWIDQVSTDPNYSGDPTDYARYAQKLRLYPIPQSARTVTLAGVERFTELSADADTNAWMTEGEELIRLRAKKDLYANLLRNPDMAMLMAQGERDAYEALRAETVRRTSTGRLRPARF